MNRSLHRIAAVVVLLVLAAPWLEAAKPASGTALDTGNALYTNLVNAWGFLEGSGGTSVDSKASNTATINHPVWSTDAAGDPTMSVASGTGTVNAITLGSTVSIAGSAGVKWSIAFRMKRITTASADNGMISGDASGTEFIWIRNGTGIDYRDGGDSLLNGTTSFTTEHDYVITFDDNDAHRARVYVDGVADAGSPYALGGGLAVRFDRLMCGYSSASFAFEGTLSYFDLWSGRVLSSSEAASLHSSPYQLWSSGAATSGCKNGIVLLGAGCEDTNAAMRIHAPFFARVVPSRGWIERQLQPLYRRAS